MSLDVMVKMLGWGMTLIPLVIFLVISGYMVWGVGQDDEVIKALILLGISIFLIGALILVLAYFTTFLTFTPVEETAMLFF